MGVLDSARESIFAVLNRLAEEKPNSPFLVFEDVDGSVEERTYGQMLQAARCAAGALQSLGVERGDRLHVHLRNCPAFYDALLGSAALGATIVPTNPLLTPNELAFVVKHAACRISVTTPDLRNALSHVEGLRKILDPQDLQGSPPSSLPEVGPRAVAAVLYTSGTTSRPKGVLVTHANYLHAGEVVAGHLRVRPDDRWLVVLPLFHANAQYYSTMSALVSGASIALMSRFSASRWSHQAARHGATLASLFAAPIRILLAQANDEPEPPNALRAVIFSQSVTEDQLQQFETRFNTRLLQLYGMTETIAPPVLNPLYGRRLNMSIGLPTLGSRLRIVDEHGGSVDKGELLVHGETGVTLMAGYLDDPEATAAVIRSGWLHTGDTVRRDSDGYLYFVDRKKDMIKRAGENVAAGEVEAVVNAHPEVFESAVIGVPDDVRDEAIKVFVVRQEGAELEDVALIAFCKERLASFKVPSVVEFVESLPRTAAGKIRKDVLRREETAN
jgi:carnitine-CoA ligase